MTTRLKAKTALVMGAGSSGPGWGNGKASAVLFAREGAAVACVDINLKAAEETAEIIRDEGGKALALACDATREADIDQVVAATRKAFGRIDILHNNVGAVELGGLTETTEENWDRAFEINVKSAFLAMRKVMPSMAADGGGAVVNISSIAALRASRIPSTSYSATKAALGHLSRVAAAEYAARKVRVNTVVPGLLKTPMVENAVAFAKAYGGGDIEEMWRKRDQMVPMGHMGDAWDVAYAALFLASDEAKYVTGIELVVDGGITLKYA